MGRIRLFNTGRPELRSVSPQQYFSFYLCICNVFTSMPQIQFVTNVRENSMHNYGNCILMGRGKQKKLRGGLGTYWYLTSDQLPDSLSEMKCLRCLRQQSDREALVHSKQQPSGLCSCLQDTITERSARKLGAFTVTNLMLYMFVVHRLTFRHSILER